MIDSQPEITFKQHEMVELFVEGSSNDHTRRARQRDLLSFQQDLADKPESYTAIVDRLLAMDQDEASSFLQSYKADLREAGLAGATVNRRLATLRSLIRFARERGVTTLQADNLVAKLAPARSDMTVLEAWQCQNLINAPAQNTRGGMRDRALLSLLCEVPLHGDQVALLNQADFQGDYHTLRIPRLAAAIPKEIASAQDTSSSDSFHEIRLEFETFEAIAHFLWNERHTASPDTPMFPSLDGRHAYSGSKLTTRGIHKIVKSYGTQINVPDLNVRTLRRTAIVRALEREGGNIAKAIERYPHISRGTWEYYRLVLG